MQTFRLVDVLVGTQRNYSLSEPVRSCQLRVIARTGVHGPSLCHHHQTFSRGLFMGWLICLKWVVHDELSPRSLGVHIYLEIRLLCCQLQLLGTVLEVVKVEGRHDFIRVYPIDVEGWNLVFLLFRGNLLCVEVVEGLVVVICSILVGLRVIFMVEKLV